MDPYFKATVTLSRIEPFEEPQGGWKRENTTVISQIEVTGDDEGSVMQQAYQHVSALNDWHAR
jgi:hypothetical protein